MGEQILDVASFIIGIIALLTSVMAIPTIFQMVFGRPKLTFDTDEFAGSDGTILVLRIKNDPVKNKALLMMGVEREAGDLIAFFNIQEQGTGKYLVKTARGLLQCPPTRTMGILARAMPGFSVGLTVVSSKNGVAGIVDARDEADPPKTPIPEGHYVASIDVMRGQQTYRFVKAFQIGKQDHEAIWYGEENIKRLG